MCIAMILWRSHPHYSLVLLFNRDEFHSRDTRSLMWWDEDGDRQVLAGKDNVGGGTWLGCNRSGKIAILTNIRQFPCHVPAGRKSRGFLPLRFLQSDLTPRQYAEEIAAGADRFSGYNLVLVDHRSMSMVYVTNGDQSHSPLITDVLPGLHVLSNASLDTPWPKALRLGDGAKEYLAKHEAEELSLEEMVETLMTDTTRDDDASKLPGIYSREWEFAASAVFVDLETPDGRYGTRSISGVSVTKGGAVTFYERCLHMGTWQHHTEKYQIQEEDKDQQHEL